VVVWGRYVPSPAPQAAETTDFQQFVNHPNADGFSQSGDRIVVERFILTMKTLCTWVVLVPLRRDKMREELGRFVGWYNKSRPHATLKGATPDEIYHGRHPTCHSPRFEPRARWPRGSPSARPGVPIRGWPGQRLELQVEYVAGRRHFPSSPYDAQRGT